nr:MAG TPA: hypothetical protein [Inoviridae sp.]
MPFRVRGVVFYFLRCLFHTLESVSIILTFW